MTYIHRILKAIIFMLIMMIFTPSTFIFGETEAPDITITSSVDKSHITIGDLITYTLTVTYDEEIQVEMPGLGANLGGFEIRDYEAHERKKEAHRFISQVDYRISTFFTGEFEIPPLTIRYTTANDTIPKSLSTEKIKIVVESVKPSEAGDIRDVKLPVTIPKDLWLFIRWFVLGGGVLIVLGLITILIRRKRAGKGLFPIRETVSLPPHEIAIEALNRLRESNLLERGEIKKYYIEISEIIRQYIGGRYFVVAMEMTTTEVLNGLRNIEVSDEVFNLFETFLNRCDLVKFAKAIPSEKEHEGTFNISLEIIEKTKVVVEDMESEKRDDITEDQSLTSDSNTGNNDSTDETIEGSQPLFIEEGLTEKEDNKQTGSHPLK